MSTYISSLQADRKKRPVGFAWNLKISKIWNLYELHECCFDPSTRAWGASRKHDRRHFPSLIPPQALIDRCQTILERQNHNAPCFSAPFVLPLTQFSPFLEIQEAYCRCVFNLVLLACPPVRVTGRQTGAKMKRTWAKVYPRWATMHLRKNKVEPRWSDLKAKCTEEKENRNKYTGMLRCSCEEEQRCRDAETQRRTYDIMQHMTYTWRDAETQQCRDAKVQRHTEADVT